VAGNTLNEGQSYKCLDRDITVFTFSEIRTFESFTSELIITKFTLHRTTKEVEGGVVVKALSY
jgi:hypothetical protein